MAPSLFPLLLAFFAFSSSPGFAAVDDFPGWLGEIRGYSGSKKDEDDVQWIDPTRIVQISWKPRAFVYKGFLSYKECDHLMHLAKSKLQKSMVADNESGKSVLSKIRTSSGMFIDKGHDEIIKRIEKRISILTFLPEENGESIQVLRYQDGEKYEPHYDYFHDKNNIAIGGHRVATVLMYLTNVTRGGETVFPNAPDPREKDDDTWSECARKGLSVKPIRGDALLFFSLTTGAVPDPMSLHGSCPVIEGEKWSATKWIHVNSFDKPGRPNGCSDENENCAQWAAAGECQKNPAYMVGDAQRPGFCRASCKVC